MEHFLACPLGSPLAFLLLIRLLDFEHIIFTLLG